MKKNLLPTSAAALARAWSAPALLVVLLTSAISTQAADFTSTWNNTTGNWSDTTKWSTPGAPGTFPNNGSPSPTYDAIQNGGDLTVNQAITIEKYNLTGGTNTGEGFTLGLNGMFTWHSSTLGGTGVVNANVGLTIPPGSTSQILSSGRTLNTAGLTTWTGNSHFFTHVGTTNNSGSWEVTGAQLMNGGGVFNNLLGATFTKSAGAVTAMGVQFNNQAEAAVAVTNATTLALKGGGSHAGAFTVGAGSALELMGNHTLNAGNTFAGAGILRFNHTNAGTTTITANAPVTFSTGSLEIIGGILTGPGAISVDCPAVWDSPGGQARIIGVSAATNQITFNNRLTISGTTGNHDLTTRTMNTAGNTTWSKSGFLTISDAVINNSGSWNVTGLNNIMNAGGVVFGGVFNNLSGATFTKSAGADTGMGVQFNNQAGAEVIVTNATKLRLTGSGTQAGAFTVGAGSALELMGNHALNAGVTFAGAGVVRFNHTNAGTTTITANAPVTFASGSLEIIGGIVDGPGAITVDCPATWASPGGITRISGVSAATDQITFNNTLSISGTGGEFSLSNRTMNTAGTTTWDGTNMFFRASSVINNSGTWNAIGSNSYLLDWGAFNNLAGATFTKSAGTESRVQQVFNNAGIVNANAGTLFFNSYTQTAGALVLNGGSVSRYNNTDLFAIRGGKIQGGGTLTGGSARLAARSSSSRASAAPAQAY